MEGNALSAAEILRAARTAELSITVDGNNIVLAGAVKPPAELLDALRSHKAEIITLLAPRVGDQRPAPKTTANPGRLGGITADMAAKTTAILASFAIQAQLMTTISDATDAIYRLLVAAGTDGVIGADIETTPHPSFATNKDAGLDPYRAEVRVLSLWNPRAGDALVIDLHAVPISELPKELWNSRLIFHNATFDTKHLLHAGAPLQADKILCSMIVAGFIARGEPLRGREGNRRPSLAVAANELLGIDVPKEGQTADWGRTSLDQALVDYAALDAVVAYQVLKVAVAKMGNSGHRAVDIACACIHGVARLELAGLPFDAEAHRARAISREVQLSSERAKAEELTGIKNLNSSPQIVAWLEQVLPITAQEKWPRTATRKLSTEGMVLRRYKELHPGLQAIADYSTLRTLVASFGLPLLKKINPVTTRLHTNLQIAQAKSGRFSSKNPNLQNLPRGDLVRSAVRAPAGTKLIVADYSQIELRVMAEEARDTRMRDAYARGLDLHAITAARMLGIPPGQFDKKNPKHAEARQKAKGVNFGIIYGCGAPGLVAFARDTYNVAMREAESIPGCGLIPAWQIGGTGMQQEVNHPAP
jgi:DNA polymerase-1